MQLCWNAGSNPGIVGRPKILHFYQTPRKFWWSWLRDHALSTKTPELSGLGGCQPWGPLSRTRGFLSICPPSPRAQSMGIRFAHSAQHSCGCPRAPTLPSATVLLWIPTFLISQDQWSQKGKREKKGLTILWNSSLRALGNKERYIFKTVNFMGKCSCHLPKELNWIKKKSFTLSNYVR